MKKGFTLIELLAVIVILAVIALIATPIVLSIINDTKESAVIRSAEFYVDAVENKIMQENMKLGGKLNPKECIVNSDGNVTCDGTDLEIEVNGDKPDSGSITFDRGRVTNITITFGDRTVITNENGELVLEDSKNDEDVTPGMITFTLNRGEGAITYEALPGMTWSDWVISEYNDKYVSCSECGNTKKIITLGNDYYPDPCVGVFISGGMPICHGNGVEAVMYYQDEITGANVMVLPDDTIENGVAYLATDPYYIQDDIPEDLSTVFTINEASNVETQYQKDANMTWSDWVISDYNINSYYISGNNVYDKNDFPVLIGDGYDTTGVLATDIISSETWYHTW